MASGIHDIVNDPQVMTPAEVVMMSTLDEDLWMAGERQKSVSALFEDMRIVKSTLAEFSTKLESLGKEILAKLDNVGNEFTKSRIAMEKANMDMNIVSKAVSSACEEVRSETLTSSQKVSQQDNLHTMYQLLKMMYEGDVHIEDIEEPQFSPSTSETPRMRRYSAASMIEKENSEGDEPIEVMNGNDVLEIWQEVDECREELSTAPKILTASKSAVTGGSKQMMAQKESRETLSRRKSCARYPTNQITPRNGSGKSASKLTSISKTNTITTSPSKTRTNATAISSSSTLRNVSVRPTVTSKIVRVTGTQKTRSSDNESLTEFIKLNQQKPTLVVQEGWEPKMMKESDLMQDDIGPPIGNPAKLNEEAPLEVRASRVRDAHPKVKTEIEEISEESEWEETVMDSMAESATDVEVDVVLPYVRLPPNVVKAMSPDTRREYNRKLKSANNARCKIRKKLKNVSGSTSSAPTTLEKGHGSQPSSSHRKRKSISRSPENNIPLQRQKQ